MVWLCDAHLGSIDRHNHSLYSSKQSAHVLTGENKSLPQAEERRDVENALRDDCNVSCKRSLIVEMGS
jgi:hypothetical protein